MLASVKRGLLHGLLVVLVVVVCAAGMTVYQMLTAPARPPAAPPPARPSVGAPPGPVPATVSPRGTVWAAPPDGTRPGMRLEFRTDGTLVCTVSDGRVERGTWAPAADGFTGETTGTEALWTVRREVKGWCTAARLDLRVRTTTEFQSGEMHPGEGWSDWSWGWTRQAGAGPGG